MQCHRELQIDTGQHGYIQICVFLMYREAATSISIPLYLSLSIYIYIYIYTYIQLFRYG